MSKLNRREFKELLFEWNQNFINERGNPSYNEFQKEAGGDVLPAYLLFIQSLSSPEKFEFRDNIQGNLSSESPNSPLFYCLDKTKENAGAILELLGSKIDDIDSKILKGAVNEDLPIFITDKSGNFNDSKIGSEKDSIGWAIHDLFHVFEHDTHVFKSLSGKDTRFAFSSPENDSQWSLDIEGFDPDTGDVTDEELSDNLEGSLLSVREFFNKKGYATVDDSFLTDDIYPTIWSYVCTHINTESDINDLPLNSHAKKMFKFYLDRKNEFIEILKSPGVKNKIFIMFWSS